MKIRCAEVINQLQSFQSAIDKLLHVTMGSDQYAEYDANISYDEENPEERLIENEIYMILEKSYELRSKISYISAAIKEEGILHKNENGRYELNGHELTCGNCIEVYIFEECSYRYEWDITRIEHNGQDYYAVGHSGVCLEGIKARVRDLNCD